MWPNEIAHGAFLVFIINMTSRLRSADRWRKHHTALAAQDCQPLTMRVDRTPWRPACSHRRMIKMSSNGVDGYDLLHHHKVKRNNREWDIMRTHGRNIRILETIAAFAMMTVLAFTARAQSAGTGSPTIAAGQGQRATGITGQFQRQTGTVPQPTSDATDFTADLFSGYNRLYDDYTAFKNRLNSSYNLNFSMQSSYFLQSATPYGGAPVSLFVYAPSIAWTAFNDDTWGSGQVNVAFSQNQYWSGTTNAAQQARIGTITGPNDWSSNGYNWAQVSYTQTLPGKLSWLSVTGGQYGFGAFDGDLYAGNAQTNFITYALAQNATQTYPNAGVGGYLTASVPNTTLSFNAGFQGATDVTGRTLSVHGYQTGKYAWFGNALWAPDVPGMGAGSYNVLVYNQPSVPMQPGHSTGVSFAMSQALNKKYGVFARANYASGSILQVTSSCGGGGIVNDPFGRHPNDQLGLGLFMNRGNSHVIGGGSATPRLWEYGPELYYNYTLVKGVQITPDAAAILNPVLAPNHGAAYIFMLRLTTFL